MWVSWKELDRLSLKTLAQINPSASILYALNLWPTRLRYCSNGVIEIDSSVAELTLQGISIGRRDYLFAGADRSSKRAAAIYTLIGTAKLNGVDSEVWLFICRRRSPTVLSTALRSHCPRIATSRSSLLGQDIASQRNDAVIN